MYPQTYVYTYVYTFVTIHVNYPYSYSLHFLQIITENMAENMVFSSSGPQETITYGTPVNVHDFFQFTHKFFISVVPSFTYLSIYLYMNISFCQPAYLSIHLSSIYATTFKEI